MDAFDAIVLKVDRRAGTAAPEPGSEPEPEA
jgi:hypothetical protein